MLDLKFARRAAERSTYTDKVSLQKMLGQALDLLESRTLAQLVIAPGSPCELGPSDDPLTGKIIAAAVYAGPRVIYQVAWFSGGQRFEEWLDACEVRSKPQSTTLPIGFHS